MASHLSPAAAAALNQARSIPYYDSMSMCVSGPLQSQGAHLDAHEGHVLHLAPAQLGHRLAQAGHALPQQLQLRLRTHALQRSARSESLMDASTSRLHLKSTHQVCLTFYPRRSPAFVDLVGQSFQGEEYASVFR